MGLWQTKLVRVWALCFLHAGWEIGLTSVVSMTTTLQHIQLCHLSPSCLHFCEYRGLGRRCVMMRRTCAKLGMKISHCNMNIKRKVNFLVSRCLYQACYWCCKGLHGYFVPEICVVFLRESFFPKKREFRFISQWLRLLWGYLILPLKRNWSGRHLLSRDVEETLSWFSCFISGYQKVSW